MKHQNLILALLVGLSGALSMHAADETKGGPKGGRLLQTKPLPAEFHVTAEGKAEITFYDTAMRPVAPATQTVTMTAEPKHGRIVVELEKTATGFVSKTPLPAADEPYRIVVQVRATPEARPQNFRIDLNLEECGECQRSEYACICGH